MNRLLAFVLVLSLGLFALSVTSPLVFGGAAGQTVNGDTNGDGDRDISDATYYLRWLFQGGPEPVPIVCPEDQAELVTFLQGELAEAQQVNENFADLRAAYEEQVSRIEMLETQFAVANAENEALMAQALEATAGNEECTAALVESALSLDAANTQITALQGQLDAANAENDAQAGQVTALQGQLAAANAENAAQAGQLTALQDQLAAANAQVAAQAEQIAALEGQDNSGSPGGLFSQFIAEDCPAPSEDWRPVAREGAPISDGACQSIARRYGNFNFLAVWAGRAKETPGFTRFFVIELTNFLNSRGQEAADWIAYCELECP
jgi:hypothetical protein